MARRKRKMKSGSCRRLRNGACLCKVGRRYKFKRCPPGLRRRG